MPDVRAIAIGVGFFAVLHISFLFLEAQARGLFVPLALLFAATTVLSGMVTGYLARRRQFISLLLEGAGVSVCVGSLHLVRNLAGLRSDVINGWNGAATLVLFCLIFVVPLVVLGGAIGASIAPKRS